MHNRMPMFVLFVFDHIDSASFFFFSLDSFVVWFL